MSVYFERHAYHTKVAYAGEDGLRLAADARPDVAVVDIRLPGIGGLDVLERLRALSPGTEVIMTTAQPSVPSAVEAMRRGAFDYLSKPLDLDEVRRIVRRALGVRRRGEYHRDQR